ncbi:PAS domain S-box protein [Candidatus Formimonas warabiya]|uniref:PAS domain-containing protein n=1 Tax=Formimonas warabiya TaxID=1761012 RepID=A0A3G1KVY0_FORW1|nr:PAS domain S-box protein [Candidatus Formimonas warabiya]ATW26519.1 hypothetical protein DCMF_18755 [Candidatus Formimonas warabiya]
MDKLFEQNNFFRTLFHAIPVVVLVADAEGRVRAINDATEKLFGITSQEAFLKRGGEVFNCVFSTLDPRGCGFSPACQHCQVRKTAMAAIKGQKLTRIKAQLQISSAGEIKTFNLLITSAPIHYGKQTYAVVVMEDVSNIVELQGLLPICFSCKKIKNDQGYWDQLEKYIEKNSEAEFTHSICPECLTKLYPDYAEKVNAD